MKLNAAEIREIEKFLTAREKGLTNDAIGAYFGLGDFGGQKASTTFKTLATIGIRVSPTKDKRGRRMGHVVAKKPRAEVVRPQPVRLSAEQWQERLSAAGF